ncbi:hypothetical protein EJ03DRAFT_131360 [Teratosphaeria nubilosa]|uniref:Uncharacterized protein n=1 Tax=Teratosphaeria nubilosa TaxID=161662 RepID=A0A6G1LLG2_9PEZI|nr:hypothetical protein EJ03DRAFT_131360 [Teratosphaeria nubilosa]
MEAARTAGPLTCSAGCLIFRIQSCLFMHPAMSRIIPLQNPTRLLHFRSTYLHRSASRLLAGFLDVAFVALLSRRTALSRASSEARSVVVMLLSVCAFGRPLECDSTYNKILSILPGSRKW